MTSKQAALEYLRLIYPDWRLGGLMNSISFNGVSTGFRGDRNCRALASEGKLERRYTDKGFSEYRYKQPKPVQTKLV